MARLNGIAAKDLVANARNQPPVMIPVVGPPGSTAALTTEEAEPGYTAVAGPTWRNEIAARVAVAEGLNRTISTAAKIRCPILIQGGAHDSIVPASVPRRIAWEAKGYSELREYPCGHWGFLLEWRDRTIEDELHFLRRHLSTAPAPDLAAETA
jgi:pimeloyl-ACP methyl ester carboxylesterase